MIAFRRMIRSKQGTGGRRRRKRRAPLEVGVANESLPAR
jgi:hypothetical protein